MNINLSSFYYGVVCFSLASLPVNAQQKSWPATNWSHSTKNCHHLLSNPAQCKWNFFDIKGALEGTIVAYELMDKSDKTIYAASVAIVKTPKETVRVLLLNNYTAHKKGEHIRIVADREPTEDVAVPLDKNYYFSEEKNGRKPVCRIDSYDTKVLKTAWGRVE